MLCKFGAQPDLECTYASSIYGGHTQERLLALWKDQTEWAEKTFLATVTHYCRTCKKVTCLLQETHPMKATDQLIASRLMRTTQTYTQ